MREFLSLVPLTFTALTSIALTIMTIKMYTSLGWLDKSTKKDHPKNNHERPVPRGGGIPIYFSLLMVIGLFKMINPAVIAIFGGGLILLILGILDDVFDLNPYLRLVLGIVAAMIVVGAGISIKYVSNPLGGEVIHLDKWQIVYQVGETKKSIPVIGGIVTILWILWSMNFVNMGAKGLDGQLPGVVVVASIVMGLLGFRFINDPNTWLSIFLAFALAGAYLGFLFFNFYPQKIMPGWGGGSLAGYFLSIIAILSGTKLATALIVLGVPLADVSYAIIRRIKAGKSPVWGDDKHLHHYLLKMGWSKRKIAIFYWIVTALLGLIALHLKSEAKLYAIMLVGISVGGLLLWLNYFISSNRPE